jgi:hypothetical protein
LNSFTAGSLKTNRVQIAPLRRIQSRTCVTQNDTQRHLGAIIAQRDWHYLSEIIEEYW